MQLASHLSLSMMREVPGEGAHAEVAITFHELGMVCQATGMQPQAIPQSPSTCRAQCTIQGELNHTFAPSFRKLDVRHLPPHSCVDVAS